jgi:phosphatidylinositol 4-kinase
MPSHEAILKVAKQHKLPAPQLPDVLAPPREQDLGASPVAPPLLQPPAEQRQGGAGRAAACLPVWRPAGGGGSGGPEKELSGEEAQRKEAAEAAYGERWSARKARVQAASPHGRRPGWDLRCVIVKTGDDCRQELLAMQLIRAFAEIFAEAQLPLWLRTYEVGCLRNTPHPGGGGGGGLQGGSACCVHMYWDPGLQCGSACCAVPCTGAEEGWAASGRL